eukprot:487246-Amphidinium_carterae.1
MLQISPLSGPLQHLAVWCTQRLCEGSCKHSSSLHERSTNLPDIKLGRLACMVIPTQPMRVGMKGLKCFPRTKMGSEHTHRQHETFAVKCSAQHWQGLGSYFLAGLDGECVFNPLGTPKEDLVFPTLQH